MKKLLFSIILFTGYFVLGYVFAFQAETCFEFDASSQTITSYDEAICGVNVDIPSQINGIDVLNIGNMSFM